MRFKLLVRVTLITVIFLLFTNGIFAQIKFGIEGGVNVSEFSIESKSMRSKFSSLNGTIFGLRVVYSLNKHFRISLQPRFIRKGGKIERIEIDYSEKRNIALSYIEFPIYLTYRFFISKFSPYLISGFTLSHFISGKIKVDSYSWNNHESFNRDLSVNYRDYSFDVGVGTEYTFYNDLSIFIEFRRSFGLKSVDGPIGFGVRNNNFQFIFGSLVAF